MGRQSEPFVVTRTARIVLGFTLVVGLGAAVAASPLRSAPLLPPTQVAPTAQAAFKPLGDGPAVSIQKSFGRHDEDCVTITQIKGADGRIYPTRGMVCAE